MGVGPFFTPRDQLIGTDGSDTPAVSSSPRASRPYVSWYSGKRSQAWATPPEFFDRLNAEYEFTMDGAAIKDNALLTRYSTADMPMSWEGERVFCNPPWSNIPPFIELAAQADLAVLLVPARTNCRWFHRALELGATVEFFLGKPKFVGAQHVSPVDCVLLVFGYASPALSLASRSMFRAAE